LPELTAAPNPLIRREVIHALAGGTPVFCGPGLLGFDEGWR
jgi:hypothetical protein